MAPLVPDTDKTSSCYTEERKAQIEGREEAFITVLAEGEWGIGTKKRVLWFICFLCDLNGLFYLHPFLTKHISPTHLLLYAFIASFVHSTIYLLKACMV